MKKRTLAMLMALCLMLGLFAACGGQESAASEASAPAESTVETPVEEPAPVPESAPAEVSVTEEAPVPESSAAEAPVEEALVPESAAEEEIQEPAAGPCTVTFSDGQTFEATVGEDFVFFFQCDAPGDMGEPAEGEEGAGITTSDGTVTYSNVGLGGPFSYPTSEKVTISGFTGDFTVTITEAATNMGATYTIYTDEQEIADAIAFAEQMAQAQAENPMPAQ